MPGSHIKDIILTFEGEDLSKYGLFPLFAWYLMDIINLPEYFEIVTVKRKRNNQKRQNRRTPKYTDVQMCMGLTTIIALGIKRFSKINTLLKTEDKVANLVGLPCFCDQSTAHLYLNEFQKPQVKQLARINTRLLREYGESPRQDMLILDIDWQTHTLESRKRQQAVVGRNRKKPGKPCLQWNVGFIRGEAVSQRLMGGKVHGKTVFKWLLEDVQQKLGKSVGIIRVDGGYLSADILDYAVSSDMQICMAARYDWVLAQGIKPVAKNWEQIDETTKLYDVGKSQVISTTQKQFRVVLVEKKQKPFPGSKSKKKILRYAIIANFMFHFASEAVYQFYHGRQTIENFFKESNGPFNAGKLPSQLFRANEAYLHLVAIAENCCLWFKKKICLPIGEAILWKPSETE